MSNTRNSRATALCRRGVSSRVQFCLHAWQRMSQRGISPADVEAVIDYGRRGHRHGAVIYFVGRREVTRWGKRGADLREQHGIHVVVDRIGRVLTVWRNRSQIAIRG